MGMGGRIITVGLSPAWDLVCRGKGLDWGLHACIDSQTVWAAGKALNVSYALAWLGLDSVAAGLWGRDDYGQMRKAVRQFAGAVRPEMTTVAGRTRQNVTVVDTLSGREMHLRLRSQLATRRSLRRLGARLETVVGKGDTCVFAGAMPGDALLGHVVELVRVCYDLGARVVVDSHGEALKGLVDAGLPWLITPNVEELCELLGRDVRDAPVALARAGRRLLGKSQAVLISRGAKGVVLVSPNGAWTGRAESRGRVISTVGCGDYLLAGFLAGCARRFDPRAALAIALKVATARARGWTETLSWPEARRRIEVTVKAA